MTANKTGDKTGGIKTLTFGCRLNTYESEVMRTEAEKAGLDNLIIVNSCAVTGEAVRQTRQAIRKARRENPDAKNPRHRLRRPDRGGDLRFNGRGRSGHRQCPKSSKRGPIRTWPSAWRSNDKIQVNDIMSVTETAGHLIEGLDGRARAFVQVQNGCDHRCTFCIIPYGRGPSRSVPAGAVVRSDQEARR